MTVTLHFISAEGETHTVSANPGLTLMEAAVNNMVPGIEAECGGACACATCHVFVGPQWAGRLPERSPAEIGMLEFAAGRQEDSRLSCQIEVTEELDQLTVRIPASQH